MLEGVILGRSAPVPDDLASGRLIRPFTIRLPAGLAYYVVYPARSLRRASVKMFRDWLLAEAAAENEQELSDSPQRAAADR